MKLKKSNLSAIINFLIAISVSFPSSILLPCSQLYVFAQNPDIDKRRSEADILIQQAVNYIQKKDFDNALPSLEQALLIYRSIGDRDKEGAALLGIGLAYNNIGKYREALEYLERSLSIIKPILEKNKSAYSSLLDTVAKTYTHTGKYLEAVKIYEQALKINREIGNRIEEASNLNNIGELYSRISKIDLSKKYYEQALAIVKEIGELNPQGTILNNIAGVYVSLGEYNQSLNYYEQALDIAKKTGDIDGLVNTYNNLGELYRNKSQYSEALKYYNQALTNNQTTNDRYREAIINNNIGEVYRAQSVYSKAMEYFEKALLINQKIGSRDSEGTTINNIGLVYVDKGDYIKGLEYFQKSLLIAQELGLQDIEATNIHNIANVYLTLGNYAEAIKYFEKSLNISHQIGDVNGEISTLTSIAIFYRNIGEYSQALEYYKKSLAMSRKVGIPLKEGDNLVGIASIYYFQGLYSQESKYYDQALKYYQQALVIFENIGAVAAKTNTLDLIGLVYQKQGNNSQALSYHNQALDIAKKIGRLAAQGVSLHNIGNVYADLQEYNEALKYYNQALEISLKISEGLGEANTLNQIGFTFLKKGDFLEAEKKLTAAIKILENLRTNLSDSQKISIFETQVSTYRFLQTALVSQNKIDAALEISERSRTRAFIELISKRLVLGVDDKPTINFPTTEEIKQISKIQNSTLVEYSINYDSRQESNLYIWVIQPNGNIMFRKVDLKLWLKGNSLQAIVDNVRESITKNVNIALEKPSRGVSQQLIPKKGDRIRFQDESSNSEAWEVTEVNTQTGKIKIRLPSQPPGNDEGLISEVVEIIDTNTTSANKKLDSLQKLHQILIEPIADLLPSDPNARVIFIPQGELFSVPFPALQDAKGKYLIEKHTILTAPSIQVLQLTREQKQRLSGTAKDVLVVGNPIMPKVALKIGEPAKQLASLPEAEKEAKAIAPLFNTKPIIGKEATKAAILPLLPKAKIIHLATHGILDDRRGLGSAIALAPSGNDSGLLTAEEILDFKQKLNAELVVLSACDTGQGRITGDGVIGLSRSLIAAGVPSVIVTLWSIPDAPTAPLMTEFYRQMQQKPDKAQALRQAMLTTMKTHPNPSDWAAFTLIGEAE